MSFLAYPKTPDFHKFRRDLLHVPKPVEGEETPFTPPPRKGTFIGTIKLHGTNISLVFQNNDRRTVQVQSRNLVISPRQDNVGAATFISKLPVKILQGLVDEILRIQGKDSFEEIFICGEWAGEGIQKGVALSALPRFYAIFNIRVDGHWVDLRQYRTVHAPQYRVFNMANYEQYEVYIDFEKDVADAFQKMKELTEAVSAVCPVGAVFLEELNKDGKPKGNGAVAGEGIVWTMVPDATNDTTLFNFKTKGEQFSATAHAPKKRTVVDPSALAKAAEFADYALGERRYEQGLEYLEEIGYDPKDMKNVSEFITWLIGDVLKEEGWRLEELGALEKDVRREISNRAREWYLKKRNEV